MAHHTRNSIPIQTMRFEWQRPLLAALLESDPHKLQQWLFSLEEAIVRRTEFLADAPDEQAKDEIVCDP